LRTDLGSLKVYKHVGDVAGTFPGGLMFRRDVWDPTLILAQIVALQTLYYTVLGGCFFVFDFLGGERPSVGQFFDSSALSFSSWAGVTMVLSFSVADIIM
jgi:hypothetical protein